MITLSPRAEELRPQLKAILFDMDGVLLDITQSIRVANILAVPFFLRERLGWPVGDDLITSEDIEKFKNAGGFNDDRDLTCAIVLHYIVRGHENPTASPETLSVLQPNLTRYAARIAQRGGGLKAAEDLALEHFTREDKFDIEIQYRKKEISQIFLELFAGEHSERLYGKPAAYYTGPGLVNNDKVIIDPALIPAGRALGVLTGRSREETQFGLELANLIEAIPEAYRVTQKEGFYKPDMRGLKLLLERVGGGPAIYIGDTLDDHKTVARLLAKIPDAPVLSALVLTGPMGAANTGLFKRSGADIVAEDVNEVLRWIAG
ncbi:haloacid dehalogenase [Capsulimonas corticalis]|uniref:Haloacid dehalogenase n=1 Tax=Capsulimonas corticalis TaxID=2219043 RepID=A0A402D357_9BACT|nr:HAD family hydrolase [Capsulimonas corticalis]BDI28471.1 haloacid dehalogenase [Capsulimonas corticalis]